MAPVRKYDRVRTEDHGWEVVEECALDYVPDQHVDTISGRYYHRVRTASGWHLVKDLIAIMVIDDAEWSSLVRQGLKVSWPHKER